MGFEVIPPHTFSDSGTGVVSRDAMNRVASGPSETQLTVAALGDKLRIPYGRVRLGAQVLLPVVYGGDLLLPFIVSRGKIGSFEAIEVEGTALAPTVQYTLYKGDAVQAVDPWLASGWTLNARSYTDTLPNIAWGVLRIPPAANQSITGITVEILGRRVFDPRDVIQYDVTISGGGACYAYRSIMNDAYVIQAGDFLEFDYFVDESCPTAINATGFEIDLTASPNNLRSAGIVDTEGVAIHNSGTATKVGRWVARRAALTGTVVGKTTSSFNLVVESDVAGAYRVLYRNVRITDGAGTVRKAIWSSGALDANTTAYSALASGIAATITNGTRYSANPTLCLADFLSSSSFGKAETIDATSLAACANVDDALVGTTMTRRRELGLALDQVRTLDEWAEALRGYAAVWIIREGGTTYFVKDAPASSVFAFTDTAGSANYELDSLRIGQRKRRANPTVVTVLWTNTGTKPWSEGQQTEKQAGAGEPGSGVPWREEVVSMPGIQDAGQARREALRRLNEYIAADLNATLVATGAAIQLRRGDVVTVTDSLGFSAKPFRVLGHKPIAPGRWQESLIEYDASVYSDVVATSSPPNSVLPLPTQPSDISSLTLTEIVDQVGTGLFESSIRATWVEPAFPFVLLYEITVRQAGAIVYTDTAAKGATEWRSRALPEFLTYEVQVKTVSITGDKSAGAEPGAKTSKALTAKSNVPGNVPSIWGYEVGGELRIFWESATDLDLTAHELRYSSTAGSWGPTTSTLINRVATPSVRYSTKDIPAGLWRIWIKGLDSIRTETFPHGQESESAAYFDVTITSDANAYVASAGTFTTPTLFNMAAIVDGWITSFAADTWNGLYTAALSTYTNPLASYHTAGKSSLYSEIVDIGLAVAGDWTLTFDASDLAGVADRFLELSVAGGESAVTINGATNATPIVMSTSAAHGYANGDEVLQAGVGGNTAANGRFRIVYVDTTHYSLQDLNGTAVAGNGAYTSGGSAQRWVWQSFPNLTAKISARFVRARIETTGAMIVRSALASYRVAVISRNEGGQVTTSASAPTTVLFRNRYSAAVQAGCTPIGSVADKGVVDMVEVSGGRGLCTGRVLRLNGTTQYATAGDQAAHSRTGAQTTMLWAKIRDYSSATPGSLVSKGSGTPDGEFNLRVMPGGRIRAFIVDHANAGSRYTDSISALPLNTWAHVAMTWDGNAANAPELYINGALDSGAKTLYGTFASVQNSPVPMIVGNQWASGALNTPFAGWVDELALFNVVLSQAQIQSYMAAELVGTESNLIGLWHFNETSGTNADDSHANDLDFTLSATSGAVPLFRPYDGMDVYRFNAADAQIAGEVFWDFNGV